MNVYHAEGCKHPEHQATLILGEGNFSFAREFASNVEGNGGTIYATSFDSYEVVHKNEFAKDNVNALSTFARVTVAHGIDATNLSKSFSSLLFSNIIFNFPHVGGKSNIKKCRLLLRNFFVSACRHLCDEGTILVALCQGQGGTPVDADRGGSYGNTWQVVSQAAFSNLYLKRLENFQFNEMKHYKQAGYRGKISNSFLTRNGLIHVFAKGRECNVIRHCDEFHEFEEAKGKFEQEVNYAQSKLTNSRLLFSSLEILLDRITNRMGEFDQGYPGDTQENKFLLKEGQVFSSRLPTFDDIASGVNKSHCKFRLNLIDTRQPINPLSYGISQNLAYVFTNINIKNLGIQLIECVFDDFDYELIECRCSGGGVINCTCVVGTNPICPKLGQHSNEAPAVNINDCPYFIRNVPASFWGCFEPECTISSEDTKEEGEEQKKVVYKTIPCNEYQLNQLEKKFFMKHHKDDSTCNHEPERPTKVTKIVINGCCTATIINDSASITNNTCCMVILHMDYILTTCYKIPDIRLLYDADEGGVIQCQLFAEFTDDTPLVKISKNEKRRYQQTILHPLCHRHDLCFWLDQNHTEAELMSAIRRVGGDYVHSVRLIKVLRYSETDLVSYCYRILYSRLDGALHHETCVAIQNELRLYLINLGFSLSQLVGVSCSNEDCVPEDCDPMTFYIFALKSQIETIIKNNSDDILSHDNNNSVEGTYADVRDGLCYKSERNHLNKISIVWHIDDAPTIKSKTLEIWLITAFIVELSVTHRFSLKNILFCGIWYGKQKPDFQLLQIHFVKDVKHLRDQEMHMLCNNELVHFYSRVEASLADLPARVASLNMKQFNGKFGCPICYHPGVRLQEGSMVRIYPFQERAIRLPDRTHAETCYYTERAMEEGEPFLG